MQFVVHDELITIKSRGDLILMECVRVLNSLMVMDIKGCHKVLKVFGFYELNSRRF